MEHHTLARTKSIEDIAKKFGVTMRRKRPPFVLGRYSHTQSMSFLETNSSAGQQTLFVKEFKDPFCYSSQPQDEQKGTTQSRNKWSSSTDIRRRLYKSEPDNNNNNSNSNSNVNESGGASNSINIISNNKNNKLVKRNSLYTVSFDKLHSGKDELNTITDSDKPILRRWAAKHKSNAAVNTLNRHSFAGSGNDSSTIINQLSDTPWGKYLKDNKLKSQSFTEIKRRSLDIQNNSKGTENTSSSSVNLTKENNIQEHSTNPIKVRIKGRPKSEYLERKFEDTFNNSSGKSLSSNNSSSRRSCDVNNNNSEDRLQELDFKHEKIKENSNIINTYDNKVIISSKSHRNLNQITHQKDIIVNNKKNSNNNHETTSEINTQHSTTKDKATSDLIEDFVFLQSEIDEQVHRSPVVPQRSSSKKGIKDFLSQINNKKNNVNEQQNCEINLDESFKGQSLAIHNINDENNYIEKRSQLCDDFSSPTITHNSKAEQTNRSDIITDDNYNCNYHLLRDTNIESENITTITKPNIDHINSCISEEINTIDVTSSSAGCAKENSSSVRITYFAKKVRDKKPSRSLSVNSSSSEYVHHNFLQKRKSWNSNDNKKVFVSASTKLKSTSTDNLNTASNFETFYFDKKSSSKNTVAVSSRVNISSTNNKLIRSRSVSSLFYNPKHEEEKSVKTATRKTSFIITKEIDIDIESNQGNKEYNINASYTDISSQITGFTAKQRSFSSPLETKHWRSEKPSTVGKAAIFIGGKEGEANKKLNVDSAHIIEPVFKTNIECNQPDGRGNHRQVEENINNTDIDAKEMGSKYYTPSPRNGNSLSTSCYDRQRDLTSQMSTTHNNKYNKDYSDKYFGRKNTYDSNGFIINKTKCERSLSLTDEYQQSYLTSRRKYSTTDEHSTDDTSYVPKSAYLRQRLQDLQSLDKRGDQPQEGRRGNSVCYFQRKASATTTLTDKVDEYIRNHKERRSSSSAIESYLSHYSGKSLFTKNCVSERKSYPFKQSSTASSSSSSFVQDLKDLNEKQSSDGSDNITSQTDCCKQSSLQVNYHTPSLIDSTFLSTEFSEHNLEVRQDRNEEEKNQMDTVFGRRGSLRNAFTRRFSVSGENKKNDEQSVKENTILESPFSKNLIGQRSSDNLTTDSPYVTPESTRKEHRPLKEKSKFGAITKIKLSSASDLKSFSSKRNLPKTDESNADSKASEPISPTENHTSTTMHEKQHKSFSRFSLKKKKPHGEQQQQQQQQQQQPSPSSPKQEPKQRKHSLTSVFHKHKKDKAEDAAEAAPTSPVSLTSPCSPIEEQHHGFNKDRRGSALYRFFHKKSHSQQSVDQGEISSPPSQRANIQKSIKENKLSEEEKSLSTSVNSKIQNITTETSTIKTPEKESDKEIPLEREKIDTPTNDLDTSKPCADGNIQKTPERSTTLTVPTSNGQYGSEESLYDSDTGDSATKRSSRNKERIRNRKLARKEAAERHKSLPAGLGDVEIDFSSASAKLSEIADQQNKENNKQTSTPEPQKQSDKRTRKKHKARRANTEFIGNIPVIAAEESSPMFSRDDATVNRRPRRNRGDRPKTLTMGIDSGDINGEENGDGVVNETMSFADIKKKLLEGLTDDKKIPEKVPQKERQKIKRTKSTKRYKTITEGIAPRDLELARQAIEAEKANLGTRSEGTRNTIDTDTLAQITAALNSTGDNRKSFIVESRPASRYQSNEDLQMSDSETPDKSKDDSSLNSAHVTEGNMTNRMIQRTKSMTTLHMEISTEPGEEEPEIKPLSELKNRFLQAMEETKQKHLTKKTPVKVKRHNKGRGRKDRPHTICGMDDWTMDQLQQEISSNVLRKDDDSDEEKKDIEQEKEKNDNNNNCNNNKKIEKEKNQINALKNKTTDDIQTPKKREKKKYTRAQSEKLFDDVFNDIDDILLNEGLTEEDLAGVLDCNPSANYDFHANVTFNRLKSPETEFVEKTKAETTQPIVNRTAHGGEPLSDLDFVSNQTSQLSSRVASDKRKLRPQRKQRNGANPMKSLQQREDLINEAEVTDRQKEGKKSSINLQEKFLKKNDLSDEAISALRATVDFSNSKTQLRKVEVGKKALPNDVLHDNFKPSEFESLCFQVKGRRKCQTTLAEFKPVSLNSDDCYVIMTPNSLFCWNGTQANVIERAKAAEVASRIQQKKEMGCKANDVIHVDQGAPQESKVLRTLGGNSSSVNFKAPTMNDEDFEKNIIASYMTYIVCEVTDEPTLLPLEAHCHRMPSKEILLTDSVFVFDFITEVYVWLGRQTKTEQRKIVQGLAAEKFNNGYYKLDIENVVHNRVLHAGHSRKISVQAESIPGRRGSKPVGQQKKEQKKVLEQRPAHSLLLQLYEGSEWVVFKEKFCDWPDESRIIRMKGGPGGELVKDVSTEVQIEAVDANTMIEVPPIPSMVLENIDIGRGKGIPKGMDGYHIITLDVKTWHVHGNQSILLPDESFGQFHSGEGYVIRWQYRIVKVRALRHCDDVLKAGGMERCCYFFWLGNDCSVNEEGATAVMTIELDREKGPQIRVVLGKEPPALVNLYDGSMIIHAGKRPINGVRRDYTDKSLIRLYAVRNEEQSEACLLQVPSMCESLRSRSSFVLLLCSQGEVFLWHGCKSNEGTRKAGEHAAQMLIQNHPEEASIAEKSEIGLRVFEEGNEPDVFWMALGGHEDYGSLLDDHKDYTQLSPRLFHLESQTGQFVSHEIMCPTRNSQYNCPFPLLQDDLYNVEQPAIFILDAVETLYLWFGWWPDEEEGIEASNSKRRRWDQEKKTAMESAVAYAEKQGRSLDHMYTIYAGLEPEGFIELFPYWVVQEDITEIQLDEGIEEDEVSQIVDELALYSKEFYTLEELRAKPPPKGVDPTKLEKYLSDDDFITVFKFAKDTFNSLPGWQQTNWKKKVGLY